VGHLAADVITGQKVDAEKVERAREFRRRMTRSEWLLWQELRAGRLGGAHFRRQQVIDGFIVDFYCHAAALVVEVDGAVHGGQRHYDAERDDFLRQRGLTVLRVTSEQVEHALRDVLTQISKHMPQGSATSAAGDGNPAGAGRRVRASVTSAVPDTPPAIGRLR
jgi:very-short-patch-repair endonuclease